MRGEAENEATQIKAVPRDWVLMTSLESLDRSNQLRLFWVPGEHTLKCWYITPLVISPFQPPASHQHYMQLPVNIHLIYMCMHVYVYVHIFKGTGHVTTLFDRSISLLFVWKGDAWLTSTFHTYNGGCENVSTLCSQKVSFWLAWVVITEVCCSLQHGFLVFFYLRESICERLRRLSTIKRYFESHL